MHRGDGKAAKALAKKLLIWCPADNLGVRMLLGDISLMTGDTQSAMKSYLKGAADSPVHWYQAGQIAFRAEDFVSACTYVRREPFALRSSYFVNELTDDLSKAMAKRVHNRYDVTPIQSKPIVAIWLD